METKFILDDDQLKCLGQIWLLRMVREHAESEEHTIAELGLGLAMALGCTADEINAVIGVELAERLATSIEKTIFPGTQSN